MSVKAVTKRELFWRLVTGDDGARKLSRTALLLIDYIEMLSRELDEAADMAALHGWKSTRVNQGKRLRAELGISEEEWTKAVT
jgi:hypothetical protein